MAAPPWHQSGEGREKALWTAVSTQMRQGPGAITQQNRGSTADVHGLPILEAGVRDPAVGTAGSSRGLSPKSVDTLLSVCARGVSSLRVCVLTPSHKDTVMWDQPTLTARFELSLLCKAPSPRTVPPWGAGGQGFHAGMWEGHRACDNMKERGDFPRAAGHFLSRAPENYAVSCFK